ncbi:MAG: phosphoribosylglycinamide formyltransferase [Bacteroidota bacterium]|nr:phosphoribosylglycinamide formyltransferase [Bacteroidota bacterium]
MKKIAIFASGTGSNTRKILEYSTANPGSFTVALIVTNKPIAGVLDIAAEYGVPTCIIEKEEFFRGHHYLPELKDAEIDLIVLAGFLWKIPQALIDHYRNRIINIHPALLPKFGWKGMYGDHVHNMVLEGGEKESGITIHYVDEHYDHGDLIFQARCEVMPGETAESLAQKIHQLEHEWFPKIIEKVVKEEKLH